MVQETVERLMPISKREHFWVITNNDLRDGIVKQVRALKKGQVLAEPVGRNTAPAIGLAAYILLRSDPDAVLGLFPSDQVIIDEKRYRADLKKAVEVAAAGENIVVLGIKPTRPETGYGYIEAGGEAEGGVRGVRRFTEKPNVDRAMQFLEAGNYYWNSGMFIWAASTLAAALEEHLPKTAPILKEIAAAYGTRKFVSVFKRLYPKCENISADFAVAEPRSAKGEIESKIFCIPAGFGWNDLGSWTALHEHRVAQGNRDKDDNVIEAAKSYVLDASGNFVHAPGRFVSAVGVRDIVVVQTDDALLITTRQRAQDVGKIVKYLDDNKMKDLV
jgi:mannose-1-phosphate guanylyltransferase